jgi:aldehyde:ferredoxin oxidoreductase
MQPILKVDLTTNDIDQIDIPNNWKNCYLGGASLAARFLFDDLVVDLDPLSPPAPLLFMMGPLTGTSGPCTGRSVVCSKSPATHLWGESNFGGFWGTELRMAGFDGLWIIGRSNKPSIIIIKDGKVEIQSAADLWGKDTYQTRDTLETSLGPGKIRVASIGLAGEHQIPFASIMFDHGRAAGRTGMGAIMGAKNLKAIAIQGHGIIPVVNYDEYNPLRSESNRLLHKDSFSHVFHELGTASGADYFNYLGELPKQYFRKGVFIDELKISGSAIKDSILIGTKACHSCVIACGRVVNLGDGENRKGPEYETLVGFGPNLSLNDPVFATRMGELCDRYGIDTISMSNTIGLAFRLFELGNITSKDTGVPSLEWSNPHGVEELIHQTANRSGFGAYLAEGARALASRFGAEDEAIHVNGLEVPYHDPRGGSGMALVYVTSPRGACHNQSDYFLAEIGQVETGIGMQLYSPQGGAEKAANVAIHQNWRTLYNSLVMCNFANIGPEILLPLINAACGLNWTAEDMLRCGERGWNIKRIINHRLGVNKTIPRLPKPLLQPYSDHHPELKDFVPDIDPMLTAYYLTRGWDSLTGMPIHSKLLELGLDWTTNGI